MTADSVADVKREILVRHLEAWAPAALHRARRATYVHGYADAGPELAQAALRVFVEQSDLVRGRELTMVALGEEVTQVGALLAGAQREAGAAAGLTVHSIPGGTDARLAVALKAVGAARVPLLAFLDADAAGGGPPQLSTVAALTAGKPAEAVIVVPGAGFAADDYRAELRSAGFPLVAAVELVAGAEAGPVLVFATQSGKSLEGFKDALWAVDEYAGVRYRDPGDPERHLIDISLNPHPGPLRRELLAHLAEVGEETVSGLRTFALTETVYRAADATRVLQTLLAAGSVTRRPEHGRLGGDVSIAAA